MQVGGEGTVMRNHWGSQMLSSGSPTLLGPRSPLPQGLGKGVYSPGLEIESVTAIHLLLARIQPHGHNHGQGSLGHNV